MDLAVSLAGRVCLDLDLNFGDERRDGGDRARDYEALRDAKTGLFD
jgi:hypothetical protein